MNLFEEINFFKNYDVGILMPIKLSLLVIPSIIINLLPFILFISSMVVFIKLKDNRDIIALKTFGFSNDIRAASQGRAVWNTENAGYVHLPPNLFGDVTAEIRERKGLKPEIPGEAQYMD